MSDPPPFLAKTYEIVDDPANAHVVGWAPDGRSFVVWDKLEFERDILPRNFKHNNFSSFIRQLNTYGFRKVDATRLEWANDYFRQGHRELLKDISRQGTRKKETKEPRLPSSERNALVLESSAIVEVPTALGAGAGAGGSDQYLATIRDKDILKEEVKRLRMQQDALVRQMQEMGLKQVHTEQTLQKVLSLLQSVTGGQGLGAQLASTLNSRLMLTSGQEEEDEGGAGRKRARKGNAARPAMGGLPNPPTVVPRSSAMQIEEIDDPILMDGPSGSGGQGQGGWTMGAAPNLQPYPYYVQSPAISDPFGAGDGTGMDGGIYSLPSPGKNSNRMPTSFPPTTQQEDLLINSFMNVSLPDQETFSDLIDDPVLLNVLQQKT